MKKGYVVCVYENSRKRGAKWYYERVKRRPQIGSSLSKNRPDSPPSPFLTHALSFSFLLHRLTD